MIAAALGQDAPSCVACRDRRAPRPRGRARRGGHRHRGGGARGTQRPARKVARGTAAVVRSAGAAAHACRRRFPDCGADAEDARQRHAARAAGARRRIGERGAERVPGAGAAVQARTHLEEREAADERKNRFLATLAHELRNPLAPIRNSFSVLRLTAPGTARGARLRDHGSPGQPHGAADRRSDGRLAHHARQDRLAQGQRGSCRSDRGGGGNEPTADRRGESHARGCASGRGARSSRPTPCVSPRCSRTCSTTPPSTPIPAAASRIAARREQDSAVVTVSDTGVGIPAESLSRVFDMFAQADARDRRSQSGLGIGLALARSLVEMHDGSIAATSEGEGKGSTFVVRLPLEWPRGSRRGRRRPRQRRG